MWFQTEIGLKPRKRGFHLITQEVVQQVPELSGIRLGVCHLFIQHTSASLCLNENADPDVLIDMESHFNILAPENAPYYRHTCEGPDDMPAHIKHGLIGSNLTIPISDGRLNLGTWQGVVLCEHRNNGGSRRIIITITGE